MADITLVGLLVKCACKMKTVKGKSIRQVDCAMELCEESEGVFNLSPNAEAARVTLVDAIESNAKLSLPLSAQPAMLSCKDDYGEVYDCDVIFDCLAITPKEGAPSKDTISWHCEFAPESWEFFGRHVNCGLTITVTFRQQDLPLDNSSEA